MATAQESLRLRGFKRQRATIKSQITRINSYINETSDLDIDELESRKTKLNELCNLYETVQSNIEEEDEVTDHVLDRDQFERQYFSTLALINKNIKSLEGHSRAASSVGSIQSTSNAVKQANALLPKIEIKAFDGNPLEWHTFHDTFKTLVHDNEDLPSVQKFHLLKGFLRGEIASVVTALNASEENYAVAWDLLKKRCNKPRQIIHAHLKSLFDLPEVVRDSPSNLRKLSEQAQMHIGALKASKQPVQYWDTILVYLISQKLDKNSRRTWERTLENEEIPKYEQLIEFINKQARGDEIDPERNSQDNRARIKKKLHTYVATANNSCSMCNEGHDLYNCPRFLKLSIRERFETARKAKICIKCLKIGHSAQSCFGKNCRKCGGKHNVLLHFENSSPKVNSIHTENCPSTSSNKEIVKTVLAVTNNSEVLLGTARVKIYDKFNKEHICRVLLDSASQAHFITDELASRLKLHKEGFDLNLAGLNQIKTQGNYKVNATIRSMSNKYTTNVQLVSVASITGLLPARQININNLKLPSNIRLADPEFHKPAEIDLLLGNTIFYKLLMSGQISLCDKNIILQKTKLGWIVTGKADLQRSFFSSTQKSCFLSVSLEKQLSRFWEVEEIPNKNILSPEETACEQHFIENTSRESSGRYTVRLPFNEKRELLGESRSTALKRFLGLEQRLQKNTNLLNLYREFLKEYKDLGHMSEIESDNYEGYYLPHHAVIKESSVTTKVRVVFDASAKSSTGISLNDILLVGPTIQDTLFSILLRFRSYKFVFTADIEKMFRQINIHSEDTSFQKILWRDSPDKIIKTYKLNTVTYGTASAPFLAVRCLKQLADDECERFPAASKVFKRDFYVDDLLTGASEFETAFSLRNELIGLANSGGFSLRQWMSNDNNLIKDLEDTIEQRAICLDSIDAKKILGIHWNPSLDNIFYSIRTSITVKCITKRVILSEISQLFDPLGLLGPVIIRAKIIMQNLWKTSLGWDEPVPRELRLMWMSFRDELPLLSNFNANRKVIIEDAIDVQLHGFSDASEAAYGACIFVRSSNKHGKHNVALICAKSRVAPIKTLSLPRLELCAARELARLYCEVKNALPDIRFKRIRFWSDSTIVLHWIRTSPHLLKTFVANRINDIQSMTDSQNWFHVSSENNPADSISRGQSPAQLLENSMWLNGPQWLSKEEEFWPISNVSTIVDLPEKRNLVVLIISQEVDNLFARFSSVRTLIRVMAYVLRFYKILKNKERCIGLLTPSEINRAHLLIIKLVQEQVFSVEINNLKSGKPLKHNSKLLNLNPFIDNDGLLRVGGRLKNAPISFAQKHPIILPRSHHVTDLIIRNEHERHWHSGIQATLNAVRQNYWPIDARNNIKRILHKCLRCYKANPKMLTYLMGNLPKTRVSQARPFLNVGIDYCGPFFIKEKKLRNRSKLKAYVVVFVCFVTKAIHLELVTDLTSEACLAAIKRFFSRRGKAQNIYSDNGTNFVGVRNEFLKLQAFITSEEYKQKLQVFLTDEKINWHLSPPRSPHFGGLWEAAVKAFKRHLHRTVGDGLFTYEQFNTLIIEVEAILNSRPLVPISSDPNDLTALTPGHFLIGDPLTNSPEYNFADITTNRLSLWQHVQKIKQHFWSRWNKDYLGELHTRSKWHSVNKSQIREGTLVTIQEDHIPPMQWRLGRIVSLHPGEDQIVRVATVRTAYGTYKRALNKLSPLPIDDLDKGEAM